MKTKQYEKGDLGKIGVKMKSLQNEIEEEKKTVGN